MSHSKSFFLLYLGLSPILGYELAALSLAWKCSVPKGRIWLDLNNGICNIPSDRPQKTPTGADKHPACREVFVNPPQYFWKICLGETWRKPGVAAGTEVGVQSVCLGGPDRTLTITPAPLLPNSPGDGLYSCTIQLGMLLPLVLHVKTLLFL